MTILEIVLIYLLSTSLLLSIIVLVACDKSENIFEAIMIVLFYVLFAPIIYIYLIILSIKKKIK